MSHGWNHPDTDNGEDFADEFVEFMDNADHDVIISDRSSRRGAAGNEGLWFLERDTGKLFYDDGNEWNRIHPEGYHEKLGSITTAGEDHVIEKDITFNQEIQGDITGTAAHADEAGEAATAENTSRLNENNRSEFITKGEDAAITGVYTYRTQPVMRKVKVTGGVISLTNYG